MAWTTENPNEETIKCVVVGDNNVGKTRLICSRAYTQMGHNFNFKKYGGSHVPTVWAIDQYRNNQDVLDNARTDIDDVTVSLRLWDTFGDHHKDRRFAYGRADVAVICFSVCDRKSMQSIRKFWLPELRMHCKKIPVLIVACKVDLRFVDLAELNKNRNRLTREIKQSDLIFPEESRALAKELDCPFYETSVSLDFGINDVFDNAIRAALMYRRGLYFWKSTLKRVKRPLLQQPLLPSKPKEPQLVEIIAKPPTNFSCLLYDDSFFDVRILCQQRIFKAHRDVLASASNKFCEWFLPVETNLAEKTNANTYDASNDVFVISLNSLHEANISPVSVDTTPKLMDVSDLSYPELAIPSDEDVCKNEALSIISTETDCVTITLPNDISAPVFTKVLELCYNGKIYLPKFKNKLEEEFERNLIDALEYFQIFVADNNQSCHNIKQNNDKYTLQLTNRIKRIKELFLWKEALADVFFEVDDGNVSAHKGLLVAGCDMMGAMFSGKFSESFSNRVPLPDALSSSLRTVIEFIYTGTSTFSEIDTDFIDLIKLANRLCLPDFVKQIEHHIITKLHYSLSTLEGAATPGICASLINYLEVAQLHNAEQLVAWCLYFLCIYYNDVCRHCPKNIKLMSVDNLQYLSENRWPPVWYIKDKDKYDKAVKKRKQQGDEYLYKNKSGMRSRSKT